MSATENRSGQVLDPLVRAKHVSKALSDAARMARASTRGRANYSGGGFKARRGATLIRVLMALSFVVGVAVPSLASVAYYLFYASDQYVAEARFSVASSDLPQIDSLGAISGLAAASIVQDTQIVTNYIGSRAAIEAMQKIVDLNGAYTDERIDFISRFGKDKPVEKFIRYWQDMHSATIALPSGFVTLKVRAFSPREAYDIANAALKVSETLVNDMNKRVIDDTMRTAQQELERATQRLTRARLAVERARNSEGLLDANKAGDALVSLINEVKSSLLAMQQEYQTKSRFVSVNAPQLKVLKERIDATSRQIAELESRLTATRSSVPADATIAASITRFAELDLERQIAERLYAGAAASVELARVVADQRRIYLNAFVRPSLPEEPQYPRRILSSFLSVLGYLSAWATIWGLFTVMRNHMA